MVARMVASKNSVLVVLKKCIFSRHSEESHQTMESKQTQKSPQQSGNGKSPSARKRARRAARKLLAAQQGEEERNKTTVSPAGTSWSKKFYIKHNLLGQKSKLFNLFLFSVLGPKETRDIREEFINKARRKLKLDVPDKHSSGKNSMPSEHFCLGWEQYTKTLLV